MKILNDNVGLITNYEVLKVMQENEESKRRPLIKETDMSTAAQQLHEELKQFDKQVIGYLSKSVAGFEDARSIQDCRKALNQYSLTKAETLQILNNAPGSEVEVNLIVEDIAERLDDEEVSNLLKDVEDSLQIQERKDKKRTTNNKKPVQ